MNGLILRFSGFIIIIVAVFFISAGCTYPPKPEKDGKGPLAIQVDKRLTPPLYHEPLEKWRINHSPVVKGAGKSRFECFLCHNPDTGCNRCHNYIGAETYQEKEKPLPTSTTPLTAGVSTIQKAVKKGKRDICILYQKPIYIRDIIKKQSLPEQSKACLDSCHPVEYAGLKEIKMYNSVSCITCHDPFSKDDLRLTRTRDKICSPCHTYEPGDYNELSPLHKVIKDGMKKGLTKDSKPDTRDPTCIDCHLKKVKDRTICGDFRFRIEDDSCLKSECHDKKDRKWSQDMIERWKKYAHRIPDDETFKESTHYDILGIKFNGFITRSQSKRIAGIIPWITIGGLIWLFAAIASKYRLK